MQQMRKKTDHGLTADRLAMGLQVQLDLAPRGSHAQCAHQIQTRIVFETRANPRRLPARRPGPFERRDQRKPAFIGENQGRFEFMPLFLSAARHGVSNE